MHSADSGYTHTNIDDLIALGAHFVRVSDKKVAAGYGGCACTDSDGLRGHDADCRGWYGTRLGASEVKDRFDRGYLTAIVPGSIGLVAVDVDGEGHAKPERCEIQGAAVAWTHLLGAREHGALTTRSGGAHLLWRVDGALDVRNVNWNVYLGDVRVAGGEVRGGYGYIVIWDLQAIWDAACNDDLAPVQWSLRAKDVRVKDRRGANPRAEIARGARAAAFCTVPDGERHNAMVEGTRADISDGALRDDSAWQDAAARMGWDGAGSEISVAWDGAVSKFGLTPYNDWGGSRRRASDTGSVRSGDLPCSVGHDGFGLEQVAQAVALIQGSATWFDGRLHMLDRSGRVWHAPKREGDALQGALTRAGLCRACVAPISKSVMLELEESGRDVESELPVPVLI